MNEQQGEPRKKKERKKMEKDLQRILFFFDRERENLVSAYCKAIGFLPVQRSNRSVYGQDWLAMRK